MKYVTEYDDERKCCVVLLRRGFKVGFSGGRGECGGGRGGVTEGEGRRGSGKGVKGGKGEGLVGGLRE